MECIIGLREIIGWVGIYVDLYMARNFGLGKLGRCMNGSKGGSLMQ